MEKESTIDKIVSKVERDDNPCESIKEYKRALQVYIENPNYIGQVTINDITFRDWEMKNLYITIKLLEMKCDSQQTMKKYK